jgi:peptidoglycan/xylan/chitin deacetylase (PgdA/CDA1 family)
LAVILTFDDGYADNLYNAKPLLERYDMPATVFVTTGYLGNGREFWWDELEGILLHPRTLPETLHLTVKGSVHQWELGEAAQYSEDAYLRHRGWNVLEGEDPTPRHRLYRSLFNMVRPLPERSRWIILEELRMQAGVPSVSRVTHRTLSPDEVFRLVDGNLIEVGSHTVTHPILSTLPVDAQRTEIRESKVRLERILGHSVTNFSYPYGLRSDYTAKTISFVRAAGFTCACSNFADVIGRDSDRFQLPRVLVRDWGEKEFVRRLGEWFGC